MATSVFTDSSEYSEDFEDSHSDSHEFSEQDIFPRLFDYLENSLISNSMINYKPDETSKTLAVGLFLTQASQSKADIIDKLKWEYSQRRLLIQKPLKIENNFSRFPKMLKSILCEMKCEGELLTITSKRIQRKAVEEVRNRVILNLATVVKDKTQADSLLECESSSIFKKSDELQDQFYWIRFSELIKNLVPLKILFGLPCDKQKSEIKTLINSNIKQGYSIKNIISLEDSDYSLAVSNRRAFMSAQDRKVEVSELYTKREKSEEILLKFLTFSTKKNKKELHAKPFPENTILNRAFINIQHHLEEEGLSQYIYIANSPWKLSEMLRKIDLTSAEEEVHSSEGCIEVQRFTINGTSLRVDASNQHLDLRAATVENLLQLPGSPLASKTKIKNFNLFVLVKESFYIKRRLPKLYLRSLTPGEIMELYSIYLYKKSDGNIPIECFPDMGKSEFKYNYVVIIENLAMPSGVFSKHWLVQLKLNETKKISSDALSRMCKWEGCMCPLSAELSLTKMVTEFNLVTSKAKVVNKKALNPLRKARTASEAMVVTDLCIFHNNLRSIMRNEGLIIRDFIYDNSYELWKATQAGLGWQEHLSDNNKLNHLCSGVAKTSLINYFEDCNKTFYNKNSAERSSEGSHSTQKLALLKEIENLRVTPKQKVKECEEKCTIDLKNIVISGGSTSYLKYALVSIQEALVLQTSSKYLKIKGIKEQIESFMALKTQNFNDIHSIAQPLFRVATAKPSDLNNTYNESIRKTKDELYKKTVSPYYDAKIRAIKKFQRSRIPKTASDERPGYLNKG